MRQVSDYNIYIGSLKDAKNGDMLDANKIKVIVNVCNDIDTPIYDHITLVKWGLDDPKEGLAPKNDVVTAASVLAWASEYAWQRLGNVLVHCAAGNNRSPLVVAVWLETYKAWEFTNAVQLAGVKDQKNWMIALGYRW